MLVGLIHRGSFRDITRSFFQEYTLGSAVFLYPRLAKTSPGLLLSAAEAAAIAEAETETEAEAVAMARTDFRSNKASQLFTKFITSGQGVGAPGLLLDGPVPSKKTLTLPYLPKLVPVEELKTCTSINTSIKKILLVRPMMNK